MSEFARLTGEGDEPTAIRYLNDYGSPRAAAEAWKFGSDDEEMDEEMAEEMDEEMDEQTDAAVGQAASVTANRGLVLRFMAVTSADVATTELYLVRFNNNIAAAVNAYLADQNGKSSEVDDVSAGTGV